MKTLPGQIANVKKKHVPLSQLMPLLAATRERSARTHCARGGHPLVTVSGQRRCRVCHAGASARHRAKKKQARAELCARAFPHLSNRGDAKVRVATHTPDHLTEGRIRLEPPATTRTACL